MLQTPAGWMGRWMVRVLRHFKHASNGCIMPVIV